MHIARAARSHLDIILEIRVTLRGFAHCVDRGLREWRASEIGVKYDARRIVDGSERSARREANTSGNDLTPVHFFRSRVALSRILDRATYGIHNERTRIVCEQRDDLNALEKTADTW